MREITTTQPGQEQPLLAPVPLRAPTRRGFPVVPSGLVGRDGELTVLVDLLRHPETRLLTLTGPGGVGKTRLAIAAALRSERSYAGSAFVALAAVQDPALVLSTIAHVLGVKEPADGHLLQAVVALLQPRHFLLVLDNFEHILAAAPLVLDLLTECPDLTILVTSRSPLSLSVEQRRVIRPLDLPADGGDSTPASLGATGAVTLFVERARSQHPEFAPAGRDLEIVAEICRRLDGLPLAIELAAAWIRVLTPAMLLERLRRPLPLLRGGAEDHPARLRTLHDAIAWSYHLLTPEEARLFRALGVFVGGCTLDAVQHVAALDVPEDEAGVLDLLSGLVDKSLLTLERDETSSRFSMLETVREFALRTLDQRDEAHTARAAHAAWCINFAERAEPELSGPESAAWVTRIDSELGNIRAAHAWLDAGGHTEQALRLGGALGWFWSSGDRFAEGAVILDKILAMPEVSLWPRELAKVLRAAGDVAQWQGNNAGAQDHFAAALQIYRELDEQHGVVAMLRGLGGVAMELGELDGAERLFSEVIALGAQSGAEWDAAAAANLLAIVHYSRGRLGAAITLGERAVREFQALGDIANEAYVQLSLARFALAAGDLALVLEAVRAALGQIPADGEDVLVSSCLDLAACIERRQHRWQQVARFVTASEALRDRLGVSRWVVFQVEFDRMVAAARQALGNEKFAAASATEPDDLEAVISEMLALFEAGDFVVDEEQLPGPVLSRRQREVLALLAAGASDREIAESLFISHRTASGHVSAVIARLNARTRAEAAILAVREGLV